MRAIDRRTGQLTVPRRRRGSRLRRIILFAIIPLVAIGIIVWGWSGLNDPPDFLGGGSDAEPTGTAVVARAQSTPADTVAVSPTPSPVPIASPAGTALPTPTAIYTPAPTEPPAPPTATPVPPTPSPTPRPAPSATPTVVAITGCAEPPVATTTNTRTVITNAVSLNMRARPGVNCDVVLNLAFGTELQTRGRPVEADGLQWLRVTLNGTTGWVATEFVDEPNPAPGQT